MNKLILKILAISLILFLISSCSYRPILDPHGKYLEVGKAQADEDIEICDKEADDYLEEFKAQRAAREAGRKAVIGGVIGAGSGAILGRNLKSAATSGVVGTAIGAAIWALSVLGEDKVSPSEVKQRYMMNCLSRKGYSVIGWQ